MEIFSLLAQETAAAEAPPKGFWEVLFDNALSITVLFVFISAVVGTILKNPSADKCLRHFDHFQVTLSPEKSKTRNLSNLWG